MVKKEKKRSNGHSPDFDTARSNYTRLVLPRKCTLMMMMWSLMSSDVGCNIRDKPFVKCTLCSLKYFASELGDLVKIPTH